MARKKRRSALPELFSTPLRSADGRTIGDALLPKKVAKASKGKKGKKSK